LALDKIIIQVGGQVDLDTTIKKLTELGIIDEKNAKIFKKNSKETQDNVDKTTKKLGAFDKALTHIGPAMAGAFAVSSIIGFGKSVVDITAKFQKFDAVLTNTLGSKSEAQKALAMIKSFAASTPFAVDELTDSFVKLANQGFKPTQDEMRKLGDLAASQGKSFNQLTEAIIDAQTGEFERLKEFGIRASKAGDQVKFTFKGVETQTKFTSDSIRKYILSLGDLQGVSGGMAAISKTLGGQISNLGDSFDALQVAIGSRFSNAVSGTLSLVGDLVNGFTSLIELPVSEKLEEERKAFNVLGTQILSLNEKSELRSKLIDQMNIQYKEYLPNLISEKTTNKDLVAILRQVNEQYVNKIIIQKQDEKIQKAISDQMDVATNKAEAYSRVASNLITVSEAYGLQEQTVGKTLMEQAKILDDFATKRKLSNYRTGQYAITVRELNKFLEKEKDAQNALAEANRRKQEILKSLGITEDDAIENAAKKEEAAQKEIVTIESLRGKIKSLTEERDKQTDISDVKRIASINKEITAIELQIKKLLGQDDATKKAKAARDEYNKAMAESLRISQILTGVKTDPLLNAELTRKSAKQVHDERVKSMKDGMKVLDAELQANKNYNAALLEAVQKREAEIRQAKKDTADASVNFALSLIDTYKQLEQIRTENRINALKKEEDAELKALEVKNSRKKISEEAYEKQKAEISTRFAKKEHELRLKQFKVEQRTALANIAINTAVSAIKTASGTPYPYNIPLVALALAQGALQAVVVKSQAPPQQGFKKGGYTGEGSVNDEAGVVHKREYVMPAGPTRNYRDELEAMRKGTYEKYRMPVTRRKSLSEARHESMAENMYRSMMIKSEFNDKNIVGAINGSRETKAGKKELAKMIGSHIGDRLSENGLFK
jgi:hypothetical protein